MSFKSSFGALEDAGGILILIWIWSRVLDLALEFCFGYGGGCGFLTGVWHLDIDLDIITGL